MIKFLIVSEKSIDKTAISDEIDNREDNLFTIADTFATANGLGHYKSHMCLMSGEDLEMCYKNNALLYVKTMPDYSYGMTLDKFYESNVVMMNIEDFNNMSNKVFMSSNELVIVWIDSKKHDREKIQYEICEVKYMIERIEEDNLKYMYFLDEDPEVIVQYMERYLTDESSRNSILLKLA